MATVEWDIPMRITTSAGALLFNTPVMDGSSAYVNAAGEHVEGMLLLDKKRCKASPNPLRITTDVIPQGDGYILHPSFKSGYSMTFGIQFWLTNEIPACGAALRKLWEYLTLHAQALLNDDGIVIWTPTSDGGSFTVGDRMLSQVRLADSWPEAEYPDDLLTVTELHVHSRFPYASDEALVHYELPEGEVVTVPHHGNVPVYPVVQVDGPTDTFILSNLTSALDISFDATSAPGATGIPGGDYGQLEHFRTTFWLNGVAGEGNNLYPGFQPDVSDWFSLDPGDNQIVLVGASGRITSRHGWA